MLLILDFLNQWKLNNSIAFFTDALNRYYDINEVFVIHIFCICYYLKKNTSKLLVNNLGYICK